MHLWLNGQLTTEENARISPSDHGFLSADGVYETLRCYSGIPFALADHVGRLEAGARAIRVEPPPAAEIERGVYEVLKANALGDARVRITLTSGPGPAGLARGDGPPTLLITARSLSAWPPTATAIVSGQRRDEHSLLAGVKTIAVIENVLAAVSARARDADEAIILNSQAYVCEATTANVFAVRAGRVETPDLASGCLGGITRDRVLRACREAGVEAAEVEMRIESLLEADEAFLTSSTREIQPLVELDERPIGAGEPGPVTRRLAETLSASIRAELGL
jgi:branched-chain amino acid aminotransferase